MRVVYIKSTAALFLLLQFLLILVYVFLFMRHDAPDATKLPVVRVPAKKEDESVLFRDFRSTKCDLIKVGVLTKPDECTWWMCQELYDHMKESKDCLIYAFGAGWNVRFDKQLAMDAGCEVHTFEIIRAYGEAAKDIEPFKEISVIPNVKSSKHPTLKWYYHNVGIDSTNNQQTNVLTLSTIVKALNHETRFIDYMKLDIEGTEFRILDQVAKFGDRIGTIGLEAHPFLSPHPLNIQSHFDKLRLLETRGFRIIRRDLIISFDVGDHVFHGYANWKHEQRDQNLVQHEAFMFLATYSESYFVNEQHLQKVRQAMDKEKKKN